MHPSKVASSFQENGESEIMEEWKMNYEFVEENQEPIYDYEDCANMIQEKTGLSRKIIADVLNAEIDYMKSIGIIDEDEEAYFQA